MGKHFPVPDASICMSRAWTPECADDVTSDDVLFSRRLVQVHGQDSGSAGPPEILIVSNIWVRQQALRSKEKAGGWGPLLLAEGRARGAGVAGWPTLVDAG